jgi:SAM-dependent methyltransferase
MEDIYNNATYLANNPNWHQEDAPEKARFIHQILKQHSVSFQSLCEVGCGTGEILNELQMLNAAHHAEYDGFDISADAIQLAKKKERENLAFFCENFAQMPITKIYDVVLIIDVIEHLRDYFTFLEGIKPKGRHFVFHIPLDMFAWSLFRENMLIESKSRVGHIHNFTEDFILSILSDYGYKVIAKKYTPPNYKAIELKQKTINFLKKGLFWLSPRFCTKTLGGFSLLVLCEKK